ncbi:hypothetical protein QAD02_010172 [Eretmocerus hayati]|uniref:Uncharacterized protein n=1 Tax=Eretmocerus hayati TaxID=131215 RepID=A0ACC2NDU4_9HYME|nr:hypothetical protein QAD02_010172 [Eretmocerus hayati]
MNEYWIMNSFKAWTFFGFLCISSLTAVSCQDSLYEQISPYIHGSDYVDPDNLYYNHQRQEVSFPSDDPHVSASQVALQSGSNHHHYCQDSPYEVFARKLISLLILRSRFKINDGIATGSLELEATTKELEILKGFGDGRISIRQIDGIIHDVLRSPQVSLMDEAMNFTDRISMYLYQHRIIFGASLLLILVIILTLKVKWTRWRVIFLLFDLLVITSFVLTWWELLLEAEIKLTAQQHLYSSVPDECRQGEISFFRSILLYFEYGKGDCLRYFEAVMSDPALKVTPLHAFCHMFSKFFFYPITVASHSLSEFIQTLTEPLPWGIKHIVRISLISSMPITICLLLFIVMGGSAGLRVGPFFHVYLHGRESQPPRDSLSSNNRQAIEIIRSEIREVACPTTTEPQTSQQHQVQNSRPKLVTGSTQTDGNDVRKFEDCSNCAGYIEEFPEEKEYEKVYKKHVIDAIEVGENLRKLNINMCGDNESKVGFSEDKKLSKKPDSDTSLSNTKTSSNCKLKNVD